MTENNSAQSSFFHTEFIATVSYHTDSYHTDSNHMDSCPADLSHAETAPATIVEAKTSAAEELKTLSDEERQTSFFEMSSEAEIPDAAVSTVVDASEDSAAESSMEASFIEEPQLLGVEFAEVQSAEGQAPEAEELKLTSQQDALLESQPELEVMAVLEEKQSPPVTKPVFVQEMSLPAALCDEALILEINSIPQKMGFKIGEVAEMLGIKQYVLRYWESEFDVLKPKKAANNQRYYTKKDVENAYLIRKLLHRDRFSIEGAKCAMKELKSFVKTEVKKERVISSMSQTLHTADERAMELVQSIRRVKNLFV